MELTKDITADVDVWETWDQKLNLLISHSIPDIYPLVARGKYGLITLVQLLEHLVRDGKVDEGLLHGKVECIVEAIDRHLSSRSFAFPRLLTMLFVLSVCKQRDVLKDAAPVGILHDPVSQPVTKKLARKSSKGGKGSWVPPDTISPTWEAARDRKELNPNGTMQGFNNFWDSVQQDKDKLQVFKDRTKHLNSLKSTK